MVKQIVKIEGGVEVDAFRDGPLFSSGRIQVPEWEATERMSRPVDVRAQLNEREVVVDCLRIGKDVQAASTASRIAGCANTA